GHRSMDRVEMRQPFLHRREVFLARITCGLALHESRKSSEWNKVQREFAVWIEQDTADSFAQFRRTSGIRPAMEAPAIVIVRVKIVPNQRLPLENPLQLLNVRNRDLARDDFRAGPKDVNLCQEFAANGFKVAFSAEFSVRHPRAIRGGTEEKSRAW